MLWGDKGVVIGVVGGVGVDVGCCVFSDYYCSIFESKLIKQNKTPSVVWGNNGVVIGGVVGVGVDVGCCVFGL